MGALRPVLSDSPIAPKRYRTCEEAGNGALEDVATQQYLRFRVVVASLCNSYPRKCITQRLSTRTMSQGATIRS
jgi:hypothetical protein